MRTDKNTVYMLGLLNNWEGWVQTMRPSKPNLLVMSQKACCSRHESWLCSYKHPTVHQSCQKIGSHPRPASANALTHQVGTELTAVPSSTLCTMWLMPCAYEVMWAVRPSALAALVAKGRCCVAHSTTHHVNAQIIISSCRHMGSEAWSLYCTACDIIAAGVSRAHRCGSMASWVWS